MTPRDYNNPIDYWIFKAAFGRCVAVAADQAIEIWIIWNIWRITGSSTIAAIAIIVGRAPLWMFSFIGASFVDKYGARSIIVTVNAAVGLFLIAIASIYDLFSEQYELYILILFIVNGVRSGEASAFAAMIQGQAKPDQMRKANSDIDFAKRAGRLIGPLFAPLFSVANGSAVLLGGSAAYVVSAILNGRPQKAAPLPEANRHAFRFHVALRCALAAPTLRRLLLVSATYPAFHASAWLVAIPRRALEIAGGSADLLGFIVASAGVGGLLSCFLISRWLAWTPVVAVSFGIALAGLSFGAFSVIGMGVPAILLGAVIGASLPFQDVFIVLVIQRDIEPGMAARVYAAWRLVAELSLAAGLFCGGVASDAFGSALVAFLSGAPCVVIGIALFCMQKLK